MGEKENEAESDTDAAFHRLMSLQKVHSVERHVVFYVCFDAAILQKEFFIVRYWFSVLLWF